MTVLCVYAQTYNMLYVGARTLAHTSIIYACVTVGVWRHNPRRGSSVNGKNKYIHTDSHVH